MSQQAKKSQQEFFHNLLASVGVGIVNIQLTNPINTLRIRWQIERSALAAQTGISQATLPGFLRTIVAEDGLWTGLWKPGLFPALGASVASIGLRYGAYPVVRDGIGWAKASWAGSDEPVKIGAVGMFAAGLTSGMVGYFLASPCLMVMTQMQAEAGRLGPEGLYVSGAKAGSAPSYRGLFDALSSTYSAGGLRGLWRGASVVTLRGGFMNGSQMMGYDKTKTALKEHDLVSDGPALHVGASVVAALCCTTCSMPFDVTLTYYQSAVSLGGERKERYGLRGPLGCAGVMLRESGPTIFMRGWTSMFAKMLPTCVLSMYLFEQFRKLVGIGFLD